MQTNLPKRTESPTQTEVIPTPAAETNLPTLPEPPASETPPPVPAVEATADEPVFDPEINWEQESVDPEEHGESPAGETVVEGDLEVTAATEAPTEPTSTPAATDTPPAAVAPVVPVGTTEVPPAEPAAVPPAQEAQPPAAAPAVMTPEDTLKWEQGEVDKLMPMYKLSEDEANQLTTEPELVIPKMAAIAHFKITRGILASVQAMLPQMMQGIQVQNEAVAEAKSAFYTANPDLADVKYDAAVMKVGEMYRAVNPKAPREEAVKVIGEMARQALGLPQPVAAQAPDGGAIPPVPTVGNVVPLTTPARQKPFTPARGGAAVAKVEEKPNQWVDLFAGADD